MTCMISWQKVVDFEKWKQVFDSHAQAQKQAGLNLERILRNMDNPNDVFVLFSISNLETARGFIASPDVPDAQKESGVIGETEVFFLE